MRLKTLAYAFLLFQLVLIGYARFTNLRYFCWAPFDEHSIYEISTTIDGIQLSDAEIETRYRFLYKKWEQRSIHNIIKVVDEYEQQFETDKDKQVAIKYSKNGHPTIIWEWEQE